MAAEQPQGADQEREYKREADEKHLQQGASAGFKEILVGFVFQGLGLGFQGRDGQDVALADFADALDFLLGGLLGCKQAIQPPGPGDDFGILSDLPVVRRVSRQVSKLACSCW